MKRNRSEFTFFLLSVLLVGLIIGHGLSGYVTAQTGSTYKDLEIFSDALSIVQSEYVDEVSTRELIYDSLKGMLNGLDAHSQFMPEDVYRELKVETEGHFGGLGIVISLDENKVLTVVSPIEDTPAFEAGVQAGDKIIKIDGEDTHGLVLEEAVKRLRGPKGTDVTITVARIHEDDGNVEELEFTLTRDDIKIPSVKSKMLENGIGYVRLAEFSERTATDLEKTLKELNDQEMRSLILDLRSNPGGLLNVAADVTDKFIDKGQLIVYTESRSSDQNLRFKAKHDPVIAPDIPIVVLVNRGSASASEIVAGSLRDWRRAVIMGETTFGKGSVQSIIPLSDGSALRLTTAKYLTPKGHSITEAGITPDIEVALTEKTAAQLMSRIVVPDAPEGEQQKEPLVDRQLERAIELLKGYDILKTLEQNIDLAKQMEVPEESATDTESEESLAEPPAVEPLPEIIIPEGDKAPVNEGTPIDE